ncbi:fasciclin domain-containing protein [Hymenobacter rubidus]|uniref:fasciclin domain-containing protein n=1 Tax=Hymenobacter rubidus TaxID=1441626 RepID=UPI0019202FF3|nr:fasciclin domain-containing protein [Hymenobacter rubidus]
MRRLLLVFLFLLTLASVQAQAQTLKPVPPVQGKTVGQTLAMMGIASRFYSALKLAKLDSILNSTPKVQYTVFAPTNDAFDRLEEKGVKLTSSSVKGIDPHQFDLMMKFHVVPGRYTTEALKAGQSLRTLNTVLNIKITAQGPKIFVSGLNTAPVELRNAYILCNNGVIHLIDDVMIPFSRNQLKPNAELPK